jgi:hypothetical protein
MRATVVSIMGRKREEDDDVDDDLSPAPGYVEPPSKWETKPVSKKVQRIFDALDIKAFDKIPLRAILETLRGLEFSEDEIRQHYSVCLRRKLWKIFGPDELPKPAPAKVKRKPKPPKRRPADQPTPRMAAA